LEQHAVSKVAVSRDTGPQLFFYWFIPLTIILC